MLTLLNNLLDEENKKLVAHYQDESYPIYFIVAQPRGASALLQQILISNLEIGYISNFLAKFYKAPLFGLTLEKDIINPAYKSNYLSTYGNTHGIHEPHEWGWFWKDMLSLEGEAHYSTKDDLSILKHTLFAITQIKQMPLLIDNIYAMANLTKLKKNIKNIKVINLTRDLYFICNSIINARLSRYGSIDTFYGHPPRNIKSILAIKNPIEQVVYQVKSIQEEIDLSLSGFDQRDILHIDYEHIFRNSFGVVEKFHHFVAQEGIVLPYKEKHLPTLSYSNDPKVINQTYKEELDFYYKKYFGNSHD